MCLIRNLLLEETTMKKLSERKLITIVILIAAVTGFVGRKMGWF